MSHPDCSVPLRPLASLAAVAFVVCFALPAAAQVDSYTIGVDGMACAFCAQGIEKKLGEIEGVAAMEIHIKKDTVDVEVAEGGTVTPSDIETAIDEAGFRIRHLQIRGSAELREENASTVARFGDGLTLPVIGSVSETGERAVRGTVVQKNGDWKLRLDGTDDS